MRADYAPSDPSASRSRAVFRPGPALALLAFVPLFAAADAGPAVPDGGDTQRLILPGALAAESEAQALDRAIESAEWDRALPALQAFLDEPGGRMARDAEVYLGMRELARRRLAALPQEALNAYRLLYAPLADQALARGLSRRDLKLLADTAERYPACPGAAEAAAGAAAILMDGGRFGEALRLVRRARQFARADEFAPALATRELSCLVHLGRRADAQALVRQLTESSLPGPVIAGEARDWRAVAAALVQQGEAGPPAAAPSPAEGPAPESVELNWPRRVDPQWPSLPSTQPVAGSGCIFVSRDGGIIALDAQTRQVKWSSGPPGLAAELAIGLYEGEPSDEDMVTPTMPVGNIHHWRTYDNHGLATLAWAAGRLYAVALNPLWVDTTGTPWAATQDDIRLTNELRCYDARNGRILWRLGAGRYGPVPELRHAWYFTAPCMAAGRAYVLAAYKGELYAVCLDAGTGEPFWTQLIGSVASRAEAERYAMELFLADCCPPAAADGVALFPTGHGLVWSCSQEDGRPLWARPYERAETWVSRLGKRICVPSGPWAPSRPVAAGDLCVLTPMDSRNVLALRLDTGAAAWQAEFVDGQALLGVSSGRVFVQHTGLTCLNLTDGRRAWTARFFAEPTGIGALVGATALLPGVGTVRALSIQDGTERGWIDLPGGPSAPGNLLVRDGAAFACSPDRFVVFAPEVLQRPPFAPATVEAKVDRYLAAGYDVVPGPLGGEQSAWTALAERIRRACRTDPAFREAWRTAYAARVDQAAARRDTDALTRLAERAPLPEDRAMAVKRLGTGSGAPQAGATADLSAAPPTHFLWDAAGLLVPSDTGQVGTDEGLVFVVRGRELMALDGASGERIRTTSLPPAAGAVPISPGALARGELLHAATDRGLLFVMPDLAFVLDTAGGAMRWSRSLPALSLPHRIVAPMPRFEAIQWLRRGRPARTEALPELRAKRTEVDVGPEWLVRWGDGLPAQAVRLDDGAGVELAPAGVRGRGDPQAAQAGTRVCVLDTHWNVLSVFDDPRAAEAAVWRLPRPDGEWCLHATSGGLVILNDLQGVLVVEAADLRPVSSWRPGAGISEVLFASDEAIVVALDDGRTYAYEPDVPGDGMFVPADGDLRPVWADVSRGTALVLEAEPAGLQGRSNRRSAISGRPGEVRAADMATGRMLWTQPGPDQAVGGMPAPRRAGDLYVFCFAGADAAHVVAVDRLTGEVAFAIDLPELAGSRVTQVDPTGGRLVLGADRTLAFGPAGGPQDP